MTRVISFRHAIHIFLAAGFLSACGTGEVNIAQPGFSESDLPGDGATPISVEDFDSIFAARGSSATMTVGPSRLTSPVTSLSPMMICVAGLKAGNFATVAIPLTGTPENHSYLSYSQYVDSSGGFCFSAPPPGRELRLAVGMYKIRFFVNSGSRKIELAGATFEIVG